MPQTIIRRPFGDLNWPLTPASANGILSFCLPLSPAPNLRYAVPPNRKRAITTSMKHCRILLGSANSHLGVSWLNSAKDQ